MLIALVFLSLLSLAPASLAQNQTSNAGSYQADGSSIRWNVLEPKNQTYTTGTLNLYVVGETFLATLTNVTYRIDNQSLSTLPMKPQKTANNSLTQYCNGFILLPTLDKGVHKVTVYIDGLVGIPLTTMRTHKTEVYFEINTPAKDIPTHGNGATIYSPCNRTYQPNKSISISASSPTLGGSNIIYSATYILDYGPMRELDTESRQVHSWDPFFGALIGTTALPALPEGKHKLTVYMKTYIQTISNKPTMSGEATVYFSVGDTEPPKILLNTISNATFNQTSIPLTFTTNEATSWMGYCLDNGTQTTITGNTTFTAAPGDHTIVMYANDTKGNLGQSEMAFFSVQIPWVRNYNRVAPIVILFVVIIAEGILLFWARKRNGGNNPE
jgi:hypothetical protein